MFHNQVTQYTSQIRQMAQQMENMERSKANQLRQITQQLDLFAREEAQGAQMAQQLNQLINQVEQSVQQISNQVSVTQGIPYQTGTIGVQPQPFQQRPVQQQGVQSVSELLHPTFRYGSTMQNQIQPQQQAQFPLQGTPGPINVQAPYYSQQANQGIHSVQELVHPTFQ